MANQIFNIALARWGELIRRAAANDDVNAVLVFTLLEANVADDTLREFDDLAALLADAGNTESAAPGFARLTLDDTGLTLPVPDDVNNRLDIDIPDQTFAALVSGNDTTKLIVAFDQDSTSGTDASIIPLAHLDFVVSPDGNTVTAVINAAGLFRATG